MNKKFLLAWIVIFLAWMIGSFVVHAVLLHDDYVQLPNLFRPWLPQGIRFGIAVALLTIVPTYMIYYVVQPMPGLVVVKQIIFDGILIVILGLIVAAIYRQPVRA